MSTWQLFGLALTLCMLMNCVLLQKANSGENPNFFNIGGVLSNNDSEKNFSETIAVSREKDQKNCLHFFRGGGLLMFLNRLLGLHFMTLTI